jgi:hypothetical protein
MVEQTQPQFIFWVKEAGVFRPGEPKMPENYLGYDLEKNIALGEREISPESLNLVSSVYLGPVNIFEEDIGHYSMSHETLERLRQHKHGTAYGLVRLAEDVAKGQGVPYFALNVVQTPKDRTWKFEQRDDCLSQKVFKDCGKYPPIMPIYKPKEFAEFVLHPTAQLYVPRE